MPLYKGDHEASEDNVHENSAIGPSAPSFPSMDHVTGYENVDCDGGK